MTGVITGDIDITTTVYSEFNFSGMQVYDFAGNFVDLVAGLELGLYIDDRLIIAGIQLHASVFKQVVAPFGGLNNYVAPLYSLITSMQMDRSSFSAQHVLVEFLGFLINTIGMIFKAVTAVSSIAVGTVACTGAAVHRFSSWALAKL